MYIVSEQYAPLTSFAAGSLPELPSAYVRFLARYGEGTYKGVFNITRPDPEVLVPFAEYDLWEHDESSPITQAEIAGCVQIGTTIDGDFLAVHPRVPGLIWLPRHADTIERYDVRQEEEFTAVLDELLGPKYAGYSSLTAYFEPWNTSRQHRFFLFASGDSSAQLPELALRFQARYAVDLVIKTEYSCKLFLRNIGGYLRLNYATGKEAALFYEEDRGALACEIASWLVDNECRPLADL